MHLYVAEAFAVIFNVLLLPDTLEKLPFVPFFCHVYVGWSFVFDVAVTLRVTLAPFFATISAFSASADKVAVFTVTVKLNVFVLYPSVTTHVYVVVAVGLGE